ncbi:MAG: hypothetical protein QOF58_7923 [Pseudonocardiales bacterium]|nr:hypothetical protein [Pseudonocardiales bacterium]
MSVTPLHPQSVNAMIEMNALFYARPDAAASDDAVAAWYRAKGHMHEQLAAKNGPDAAQERAHAAAAHEHARRLELRGMAA